MKEILKNVGLTEGEIQVYLALIQLGQSSTGKITHKAKIASSKVYEVLERLSEKGLVSYVIKNGVKNFDATPPERLIDFLEERKE
jgi:sugar-specific transcriptional regulator TrmB